ncbi:sensor histidine kinase [Billgrantia azerbaijanica]|nr:sensor histidine kinase [Halomonas azerbaijanica]
MELILALLQQMSVYLVIAYLFSKTPLFKPLVGVSVRFPHKLVIYLVFSGFCIMGTYFGLQLQDAIANTRAIGAVLGGLLGGPVVGFLVGLTGGLHRYSLGGFTDLACAISTTAEGLLAGLVHFHMVRKGQVERLLSPGVAFVTAFVAELMQMAIILLVAKPVGQAWALVQVIAPPMLLANAGGAALFMNMVRDQKAMYEKYSSAFSTKALQIAERITSILAQGFNERTTARIARIVYEATEVGAVAITDREKLLAFIGIGEDHHLPGTRIASAQTLRAIDSNEVIFLDGIEEPYQCSLSQDCKLGSTLVIPLQGDNEVIGTIKLYEPKKKLFRNINRTLGNGIASLLSSQILSSRYEQQKNLLVQAELKLVQAQINPHFLFNALNTISAIIRRRPEQARDLLLHLSHFFRKNLKRTGDVSTLAEELDHVRSYLKIEMARFEDRLAVDVDIDENLYNLRLPTFTLQPIIENAIKHGISTLFENGRVCVSARTTDAGVELCVEDNAGNYRPDANGDGLGMGIVDKRIKNLYGERFGVSMECQPEAWTRVKVSLPKQGMTP